MSNIGLQIRQSVPSIDPVVADYAVGYIQHVSQSTEDSVSAQQVDIDNEMEFIKELLINAGGSDDKVSQLAKTVSEQLTTKLKENMAKLEVTGDTSRRLLDVNLLRQNNSKRDINSSLALLNASNDIEHTGRKMETRVDKKKLEKQERKIAKRWPREITNLSNMKLLS